jgi:DNA repair protein RecN (Recombination protein N)
VLETLYIKNLALVRDLEIEFSSGFNVITGETGAGKSLIMGALQLLCGNRASKSMIRRGEERCEVTAGVRFLPEYAGLRRRIGTLLEESGISLEEDQELLLRRVVSASGSRAFVNSSPVTMHVLGQLGEMLIDIHGPQNNYSLLRPRYQQEVLDSFAGLASELQICAGVYSDLSSRQRELAGMLNETRSNAELELVRFQLAEIDAAELLPDEIDDLMERHAVLSHSRSLIETAFHCRQGLTEADNACTEQLAVCLRMLQEIENIDATRGGPFRSSLESIIEELQELSLDLDSYADSVEINEEELQQVETRLDLIRKLKHKYGGSVQAVLEFAENCRETLGAVEQRDKRIATLEREISDLKSRHLAQCAVLSQARQAAAGTLAAAISAKLDKLGFASTVFEIRLSPAEPGSSGGDQTEFCFSPNPGEETQPLRHIASSGEIARVMLAVKTVLSAADKVPILVFDEVDANIGGRIAVTVAEELAALGTRHQTLCISHLPQIAAAADKHFQVRKQVLGGRTSTEMTALDEDRREEELARMLGATADSAAARDHVREMLEIAASRAGQERPEAPKPGSGID